MSKENFSGYGLALNLAKKIREQGQQQQIKAGTKQTTEVKK